MNAASSTPSLPAIAIPAARRIRCPKCSLGTEGGYWALVAAPVGPLACPSCGGKFNKNIAPK